MPAGGARKNRLFCSKFCSDTPIMLELCSVPKNIFGYLTIILRNRAEYHLILSRRGRRPSWLNQGIFRKIDYSTISHRPPFSEFIIYGHSDNFLNNNFGYLKLLFNKLSLCPYMVRKPSISVIRT